MDCRLSAGSDAERCYLGVAQRLFPGVGRTREVRLVLLARERGMRPDLMMLHDAGGAVAGLAHAYRRIRLPNGQVMRACLMIGAWTPPEARGRGAFTRLIGESIELAAARQVGLLLAYFACTSPSAGRMRAAGAALFPSWHIRSPAERRIAVDGRAVGSADATGGVIADRIEDHQDVADAVRLVYTADEWRDQFVLRPIPSPVCWIWWPAEPVERAHRADGADRVLSLTFSLIRRYRYVLSGKNLCEFAGCAWSRRRSVLATASACCRYWYAYDRARFPPRLFVHFHAAGCVMAPRQEWLRGVESEPARRPIVSCLL